VRGGLPVTRGPWWTGGPRRRVRAALALAPIVGASLLGATPAEAHLIPAGQGTLNIVDDAVFAVLSVPTSSLHGADDNGDGTIDMGEFERHEASLRAEIDRRLAISDGTREASTVRVDLILSPQHEAVRDRADQIVALKHARFEKPPGELRVRCDLFGAGPAERELRFTATRHPTSGTETQVAVLVPAAPEHAFFEPPRPAPGLLVTGGRVPRSAPLLGLAFAAAMTLGLTTRSRGRRLASSSG
jgi:hypothetical protein